MQEVLEDDGRTNTESELARGLFYYFVADNHGTLLCSQVTLSLLPFQFKISKNLILVVRIILYFLSVQIYASTAHDNIYWSK
jgi:hypothetical protein